MSKEALKRIEENKKSKEETLDLSACDLKELPKELEELVWLTSLFCYDNQISDLNPIANLSNLTSLYCSENQISDLNPIAKLSNLMTLSCSKNQISDLNPIIKFFNLTELDYYNNQISDLNPIAKLSNLTFLSCSNNQISDLNPILEFIQRGIPLEWQDFDEFIRKGPRRIRAILVKNNPLICPPVEIAKDSPQAVRDYFEELGEDGRKLNEVKVIFLGEASAGKTSLVKRLMGEAFDSKESQTHGIRIRKVPFDMSDGDQVTAHLWDFGGQEVMHATHQFFLSQRSVYVLLLNSRNDDQAEKWLKHAASFGGNSPGLVVLNKIDENPSFEVERKTLQEKYPQIKAFFRVSCKTESDRGLLDFKEALRQEIDGATTRLTPFPKNWLAVKEHFSNMEADYIGAAEYQKVCVEKGVSRQVSQDVLLQFLHDLGVVINFRNLQYFDTQILNPLWLTNGVYRIINSTKVVENEGILREADFDAVINDPRYQKSDTSERQYSYPKDKLHYIVRVMEEFELCFMLENRSYVIPQLLPVAAPDWQAEGAMLQFVIHFPDFMPDSIFPRLMVKLHTFIQDAKRWRTGMILHKPNVFKALARVRWDKEDQKIRIEACGEERRRFLSYIRETVKEIVEGFTKLAYNELVPIPESKEFLDYEGLVEAEKAGEKELFVWQVKKKLKVADLLEGVEEAIMRDEMEQLPVKAFVSYSHKDLELLKELRTALSPLVRLQKLQLWDDRDIDAGEEWRKEIFQQMAESDIVICLVSADFVASDFCYQTEFGATLAAHQKGEKTIIPVRLRKTDWQDLPLSEIQGVPGEWINSLAKNKRDDAWTKVSERLRPALAKAKQRKQEHLEKMKNKMG
ncbi:MAG TPA: COR domain-containing protein [Haliscomenobacter sp.]|uniref:COR domain-containing protein n=1 Tax=Haliscomenobacter sp. TaxID=2717303 RepID=UPI002B8C6457|nr:COR domain-containing protein [Haliscomenobacter sp.]HOY17971.1 COR domain-containing protein [Haliscomenobacter sp.]HPH17838.1 COR domain-containing protein [Haliscomenobacter sp.]